MLEAAAKLFVAVGYGGTTIRAIGAAADVDPALVVHYFGSKKELFGRVTRARALPTLSGTAAQVTEQILTNIAESLVNEPVQSLAVLRSMLTHPEAAQAAGDSGRRYEEQVRAAISAPDRDVRAALVVAVILGVVVSRHLLRSDTLARASPEALVDVLRPCLHELTRGKRSRVKPRPRRSR